MSELIQPEEGLFLVYRTSGTEPPCEEAFEVQYLELSILRTPVTHLPGDLRRWNATGENHRIEKIDGEDWMLKDFSQVNSGWAVRLPDLQSLLQFAKTHEDCIIRVKETGVAELEIYDYYRE